MKDKKVAREFFTKHLPVNIKNSIPENNVEALQMTNDDNIDPHFDIGDRVHVRGALYRHFQNCDRSRVLIDVIDVKVIEREHKYSFQACKSFLKMVAYSHALDHSFAFYPITYSHNTRSVIRIAPDHLFA
jgi:hypothetical protein